MPTLLLMRHAKSDWDADYGSDHERPLNDRGVRSARIMGEVLASRGMAPDVVIASTAVRARTTAELAMEAGQWRCRMTTDERLYGPGPDSALAVAKGVLTADRLMLVGHQPTWADLVRLLTGETVEMKTATVAVMDAGVDEWSRLSPGLGSLLDVIQPRQHL